MKLIRDVELETARERLTWNPPFYSQFYSTTISTDSVYIFKHSSFFCQIIFSFLFFIKLFYLTVFLSLFPNKSSIYLPYLSLFLSLSLSLSLSLPLSLSIYLYIYLLISISTYASILCADLYLFFQQCLPESPSRVSADIPAAQNRDRSGARSLEILSSN